MTESALDVLVEMSGQAIRSLAVRGRRGGGKSDGRLLLRTTTELQAVATVFVMLELLSEDQAEQALADHRRSLESSGVKFEGEPTGELTLRPSVAYGFDKTRHRPVSSLRYRPLAVAAPAARLLVDRFEVLVEWLALSASELRGRAVVSLRNGECFPHSPLVLVVPCTDDRGHRFDLEVRAGHQGMTSSPPIGAGSAVTAYFVAEGSPVPGVSWIELQPSGGPPQRIHLHEPAATHSGTSLSQWPTPAEWILAALLPNVAGALADATFGVGLGAEDALGVAGAVADALLAVGAVPSSSPLLTNYPDRHAHWSNQLSRRHLGRSSRAFDAGEARRVVAVGVEFPLKHGIAVLDAVVVQDRDVWLHAYVFPDSMGEYWPVNFKLFGLYAIDDVGRRYESTMASHRAMRDHEGSGDLWLWPPLDPAANRLRFVFTTPWEAAWTEIDVNV